MMVIRFDDQNQITTLAKRSRHVHGERMRAVERTDDDTQRLFIGCARNLVFTHSEHTRTITALSTDSLHCLQRERTTNPIDLEPVVLLKLTQPLCSEWSKDAIRFSAVESKTSQPNL